MHTHKTVRLFLASLLLISFGLSSLAISPAEADTGSTVTISPTVIAKLDAFIVKVQALRSKYSSDENWNTFLTNLNTKIGALKPQYTGNALILAVLDRLSSGVNGIKSGIVENTTIVSDATDLCAQQGLNNIDESNWENLRESHIIKGSGGPNVVYEDDRQYQYKMGANESYSFPIVYNTEGNFQLAWNPYIGSYERVENISDKKCDFTSVKEQGKCDIISSKPNIFRFSINNKYANPNYVATTNQEKLQDSYMCKLIPWKKYYLNVRWLRKSDIVDGDRNLLIDPTAGMGSLLDKFSPAKRAEVNARRVADTQATALWNTAYTADYDRLYKQEYDRLMKEEYTTLLNEENKIRAGTDIIASRHRTYPIDTYIKTIFENRAKEYATKNASRWAGTGTSYCEVGPCN